jgi:hypothetical protein
MDIKFSYDPSVKSAPSGFKTALQYAATQLDALITNNITITIEVGWDNSVLGEGGPNGNYYSYDNVVAALQSHQTAGASTLPATDPTSDGLLYLSGAQAESLGLDTAANITEPEGGVTFGNEGGLSLNFSTSTPAIAGEFDFVGIAEHELTHAIGRMDFGTSAPETIQDLFRYSAAGVPDSGSLSAYFSINDGVTDLGSFSSSSDTGDWASSVINDSFDAYATPGVANTISSADKTLLSAIGFNVACFCPGTQIAIIKDGREQLAAIETLRVGEKVLTKRGPRKIRFIGHRAYQGAAIAGNELVQPICISAGALGTNSPAHNLFVSPGHAMLIGSVLVQARHLINGVNITQASGAEHVHYYHIGLAGHHVIKANGSWAETYCDQTGLEDRFENQDDYRSYMKYYRIQSAPCRPLLHGGPLLASIRQDIAQRAPTLLRGFVDRVTITRDPWHLHVDGWAQSQADGDAEMPVLLNIYAGNDLIATTLANTYRVDLRGPHLADGRHNYPTTGRHAFQCEIDLKKPYAVRDISVRGMNGQVLPLSGPQEEEVFFFVNKKGNSQAAKKEKLS